MYLFDEFKEPYPGDLDTDTDEAWRKSVWHQPPQDNSQHGRNRVGFVIRRKQIRRSVGCI